MCTSVFKVRVSEKGACSNSGNGLYLTAAENGSSGVFGKRTTSDFGARFKSLARGVREDPDEASESSLLSRGI